MSVRHPVPKTTVDTRPDPDDMLADGARSTLLINNTDIFIRMIKIIILSG